MSITTDSAVWFVMWLGSRVVLLETSAGKTLSDITWWMNGTVLREREREWGRGGKRALPLMDPTPGDINMHYTDQISIRLCNSPPVLMGWLFETKPACSRVTGFSLSVELMQLNIRVDEWTSCIQVTSWTVRLGSLPLESHSVNGDNLKRLP